MAVTTYGVNDPNAVKLWSKYLNAEVLKTCWAGRFMGGASAIIQEKDETSRGPGDRITYGLRMQGSGAGVSGDNTATGTEEALTVYTDSLLIDQLRHQFRNGGRMSQQRVSFDMREEAMSALRDWWADRIDTSFFNQMCGNTVQSDIRYTGMQAPTAPDASHQKWLNSQASDGSVSTTDTFTLSILDAAVEAARTLTPAIRPVNVDGRNFYVAFLHPYQATDMRVSTTTGQWLDIQKAAMSGGEVNDNPIFDGSLGVYNGVILHSDVRVTYGISSSAALTRVRRAVFAGAQAAVIGYGRQNGPNKYNWVEELFDYGNQLGISAGMIWGLKKSVFNSADYGTIVLSTQALAH